MEMCPMEQDDFDGIVFQNQKRIYRTLLLLVRDADAAENLTQECFLHAFRMRNGFRGESGVATWLVRIAINLAHDHNRNRRWAFWSSKNNHLLSVLQILMAFQAIGIPGYTTTVHPANYFASSV